MIKLISDQVQNVLYSEEDHSSAVRSLLNSCVKASYAAMLNCRHSVTGFRDVDTIVESGLLIKDKDGVFFTHYTFLEFLLLIILLIPLQNLILVLKKLITIL